MPSNRILGFPLVATLATISVIGRALNLSKFSQSLKYAPKETISYWYLISLCSELFEHPRLPELFKSNALLDIPLVSIVATACGVDFAALLDRRGLLASLLLLLILFGISLSVRGF